MRLGQTSGTASLAYAPLTGHFITSRALYGVPKVAHHVCAVADNAFVIAKQVGVDGRMAETAALFHDWDKDINRRNGNTEQALIAEVERNRAWFEAKGIFVDSGIEGHTTNKWIAHALTSAKHAHDEFGIGRGTDVDILRAIAHHQVAVPFERYSEMTALQKVIFLADYIDRQEKPYEKLTMELIMATKDLDLAILTVLTGTIETELTRTDKVPTPNGNLIKLWIGMASTYKDRFAVYSGLEKAQEGLRYIDANYQRILSMAGDYLKGGR